MIVESPSTPAIQAAQRGMSFYRSVPLASIPEPEWHATLSTPPVAILLTPLVDNATAGGIVYTSLLVDSAGDLVAPGGCLIEYQIGELIVRNGADVAIGGTTLADIPPYISVVSRSVGGAYATIRVVAISNVPPGVDNIELRGRHF